jgi:hypothetical protein
MNPKKKSISNKIFELVAKSTDQTRVGASEPGAIPGGTYRTIDKQSSLYAEESTPGWGHAGGKVVAFATPVLRRE